MVLALARIVPAGCANPTPEQIDNNPQWDRDGLSKRWVWGKPVEGQAIAIRTDRDQSVFGCGEEIGLDIRLKNVGRADLDDLREQWSGAEWRYSFTVLFPDGDPVPLTESGKRRFEPPGRADLGRLGLGRARHLKPGKCFEDGAELTTLFDLRRPGTYKITVKRRVVADGGRPSLLEGLSNTLENTIVARYVGCLGCEWRHQYHPPRRTRFRTRWKLRSWTRWRNG